MSRVVLESIDKFIRRPTRLDYCSPDTATIDLLFTDTDKNFFVKVLFKKLVAHTYTLMPV